MALCAGQVIVERELTIVGQQRGNMIGPYQTKAGDKILLVCPQRTPPHPTPTAHRTCVLGVQVYGGLLTPKQAFDRALSSNTATTWIVRGVGWFGMFIGFAFCFQPVVVVLGVSQAAATDLHLPLTHALCRCGTDHSVGRWPHEYHRWPWSLRGCHGECTGLHAC